MLALLRQQAVKEKRLNLAVSLEEGTMDLQQDGSQLRQMRVEIGPEAVIGQEPGAARITPPLGKRHVARVVDDSYVWQAPAWIYGQRGQQRPREPRDQGRPGQHRRPPRRRHPLYSRPAAGPLADESYVLPGGVRVDAADLEAIRENLTPGTRGVLLLMAAAGTAPLEPARRPLLRPRRGRGLPADRRDAGADGHEHRALRQHREVAPAPGRRRPRPRGQRGHPRRRSRRASPPRRGR